jgi:hypothetical protein
MPIGKDIVKADTPVREIKSISILDSGTDRYVNRLLVGTPALGLVRWEWVQGRYNQVIPTNWSMVQMSQFMQGFIPLRYQVADAQNLIVRECIQKDFEWLLLIEHDVVIPSDTFLRLNQYMIEGSHPVVSGLYYTRSRPAEPLIYRGRGNGCFVEFELGDLVYADGVPTGIILIHHALLKVMWEESEEYEVPYGSGKQITRKVFETPRDQWFDPENNFTNSTIGTSDLDWCTRIMEENFFEKSGWEEFQEKQYPFLVDTNIFCKHIEMDGTVYP